MSLRNEDLGAGVTLGLGVTALLLLWVACSHFEARAYERVTGRHVSTTDAMFLELRVPESPMGEGN
jgi:hypothetical protein